MSSAHKSEAFGERKTAVCALHIKKIATTAAFRYACTQTKIIQSERLYMRLETVLIKTFALHHNRNHACYESHYNIFFFF